MRVSRTTLKLLCIFCCLFCYLTVVHIYYLLYCSFLLSVLLPSDWTILPVDWVTLPVWIFLLLWYILCVLSFITFDPIHPPSMVQQLVSKYWYTYFRPYILETNPIAFTSDFILPEWRSNNRPPLFNGINFAYWKHAWGFIQSIDWKFLSMIEDGYTSPTIEVDGKKVLKSRSEWDEKNFFFC